ncbi:hypothetical protein LMG27174_01841 [Paraburkholderia rhynchosiae]|uniref:Uncharacterized protein n=1 Tax=Paraburkholderia rhynchosiae TaxID=487049 RepID=A0A6J5AD42_9BURK|nr:hypothetical protein LMG27174_01841 [Paraburkholderia rhynchosiae]
MDWVTPYAPSAIPTSSTFSPPGIVLAYIENTGMIMKRPSMRSAKMAASDTVARNSGALMREEVADGLDIGSVL